MVQTGSEPVNEDTDRSFRRLLTYIKPFKVGFILSVIGMLGYAAIDVYFLSNIETFIDQGLTKKDHDLLLTMGLAIPLIFFIRGVFNFLSTYALAWVGNHVVATMRQQLFEHLMNVPVSFHDKHSTGELLAKITYDTEQINNASSKALLVLIREGAFVIGLLGWMFFLSWQLSAIFLVLGPIVAIIVRFVSKRFRQVSRRIQSAIGGVTSVSEQMINAHKVVIAHGGQEIEANKFDEVNSYNRQQQMKLTSTRTISVSIIQIIASFALAAVLIVASNPAFLDSLSPGTFTTVVTCMMMLLRPLKMLTTVNSEFQKGMAACSSIFAILDKQTERDTGTTQLQRVKGNIRYDNVDFTYPGKQKAALHGVSLEIGEGQTLALVGKSGSGKSTISHLVNRFYEIETGQISIDGIDVKSVTLTSLRRQFAIVSQQVVLFNDSVANNIAYGMADQVTAEQIQSAAQAAHVLDFTNNMPEGLDTVIGENGVTLSGGQRQRIAIARAILRDAPILILDEATSALDTESERHIQDAIDRLRSNRTAIVIAHRLSTIESADKIAVVDQGRVIEQGSHAELIELGGHYRVLHDLQFGTTNGV